MKSMLLYIFLSTVMNLSNICVPLFYFFSTTLCQDEIIRTQNGLVKGSRMSPHMFGFRGIPYAKPPINELRFEPPQDPDNWKGVWDATFDRSECIQIDNSPNINIRFNYGYEDCLYINVYTPQLPTSGHLLPVMVWIYGGIYLFGSSNYSRYAPDYLVERNVIFVSFNYRLGIFGFLSTNDNAAPGNTGLKDQIFALKWVQNNIKAFGGDPNSVTVFGESVGSVSISYLLMSPLAKGLFRSAIMESGTSLCLWSISRKAKQAAYLVGDTFGIITLNSSELVRKLKLVPAEKLQISATLVMDLLLALDPINGLIYAPVIEPPNENAVISRSSYEAFLNGEFNRVPTIIGFNSAEGAAFSQLVRVLSKYLISYDLLPGRLVPASMNIRKKKIIRVHVIGRKIKEYYAGKRGSMIFPGNSNFISYLSGNEFVRPIRKTAELVAKYSIVYFYKFSYTSDPNSIGAAHTDEFSYIFVSNRTSPSDIQIRRCMVGMWTNFAKSRNPTQSSGICPGNAIWLPMSVNKIGRQYLLIDRNTSLEENPNQEEFDFWENLFTTYGNPPYSTY